MKLKSIWTLVLLSAIVALFGMLFIVTPHGIREKNITLSENGERRSLHSGFNAEKVSLTFVLTRGPTKINVRIYQTDANGSSVNEIVKSLEPHDTITANLDPSKQYYIDVQLLRGETGRATFQITSS